MKTYNFILNEKDLHNLNIMIESCFNIGGTKITYEDKTVISLAEIAVDIKRSFDVQINEQNKKETEV